MSTPPHTPPAPPRGSDTFFDSVRRSGIWRTEDRWIGGVAAGTAHRLGIDPVLVRGLLVVLSFFGGLGILLYGLGWALLPEARDGRIHLQQAMRGHVDAALAGAIAFVLVGVSRPVFWWDFPGNGWGAVWTIALVALVVAVVVSSRGSRTPPQAPPPPGAPFPPHPVGDTYPMSTTTTFPAGPPPGNDATSQPDDATRPFDAATPEATSTYAGPSAYAGPGYSDVPPPPPHDDRPVVPPPPPVPGPGGRTVSTVLALCLLTTAGLLLAHRADALDGNLALVLGGSVLAILGLGVLLSGARGRRQGALGGLAIVLAIVLVPAATAVSVLPGLSTLGNPGTTMAGDPVFRPASGQQAREGYSLGAGELTVDLTELGPTRGVVEVPVEVGFGVARVIVPDDAGVEVRASVGGGEVTGGLDDDWSTAGATDAWDVDADWSSIADGMGLDVILTQEGPVPTGSPEIRVEVEVGFGQVVIEERS